MPLTRTVATSYTHTQTEASATWTIVHGVGGYPIVDAYTTQDGELLKIIPSEVTYVDANTCMLSFTVPFSGFATVT